GLNVYPKEVELEIDRIKGVDECAVIGLPHADFGEAVTAIVRRDARLPSIEETEITDALKARIAGFKQPKRVLFIDDLPRNAMGKVQKNLLREQFSELYD
ncbi:MAG TPA: malonyl-CoA synthase, partial [Sneathiellales bacterium]|nr:malonyl-CoA synthase [Sneathiellales bacterium]